MPYTQAFGKNIAVHIHRPRPTKGLRKMAKIRNGNTVRNTASRMLLANPYLYG
jgi:hypothetical protein